MIRVDGRARFLDCPPLSDELVSEYVTQILAGHHDAIKKTGTFSTSAGAVDVAHILPGVARFRTNIFHSREKYAIVMRRIVTKIPNVRRPEPSPGGRRDWRIIIAGWS